MNLAMKDEKSDCAVEFKATREIVFCSVRPNRRGPLKKQAMENRITRLYPGK